MNWKFVPAEPTSEMLDAVTRDFASRDYFANAYRKMIGAAPSVPVQLAMDVLTRLNTEKPPIVLQVGPNAFGMTTKPKKK